MAIPATTASAQKPIPHFIIPTKARVLAFAPSVMGLALAAFSALYDTVLAKSVRLPACLKQLNPETGIYLELFGFFLVLLPVFGLWSPYNRLIELRVLQDFVNSGPDAKIHWKTAQSLCKNQNLLKELVRWLKAENCVDYLNRTISSSLNGKNSAYSRIEGLFQYACIHNRYSKEVIFTLVGEGVKITSSSVDSIKSHVDASEIYDKFLESRAFNHLGINDKLTILQALASSASAKRCDDPVCSQL